MAKITEVHVQDFKRIKSVDLIGLGNFVEIQGRNAQGKSSLLDAIEFLLAGAKALPLQPIRAGADQAEAQAKVGDLLIQRRVTPDGKTAITLKAADGSRLKTPQAILDSLFGAIAFDPSSFTFRPETEQAKMLRDLVGLDVSDLDARRKQIFEERTEVGRAISVDEGAVKLMPAPDPDTVPAEPIDLSTFEKEQAEAKRQVEANNQVRKDWEQLLRFQEIKKNALGLTELNIKDAEEKLRHAKYTAEKAAEAVEKIDKEVAEFDPKVKALVEPDYAAIQARLKEAIAANQRFKEAKNLEAQNYSLEENRKYRQKLTDQLEAIDQQKADRLAACRFPIEGLSLEGDTVLWKGVPIRQASSAERFKIGLAVCEAMNPKLRAVVFREGALLDRDTMQALKEWAEDKNFQVFVERVDTTGEAGAVVIEDGEIKNRV